MGEAIQAYHPLYRVPAANNIRHSQNDIGIIRGIWESHVEKMRQLRNRQIPFINIDNGYFFRNPRNRTGYFRFTWNDMQAANWLSCPGDRWEKLQEEGLKLHDWKDNPNGPIVICRPSPQVSYLYNLHHWLENTIDYLKKRTNREIIIREKPRGKDLTVEGFQNFIERAYCVVSYNSIASIEAAMFGIPTIAWPSSAAYPVATQDISQINKLVRPDRLEWVKSLSYSQYNWNEIESGMAMDYMLKTQGKNVRKNTDWL